MEGSMLSGQWKVKETTFLALSISRQQTLFKPSIFSFDLMVLLYHGSKPLLMLFFPFPQSINSINSSIYLRIHKSLIEPT